MNVTGVLPVPYRWALVDSVCGVAFAFVKCRVVDFVSWIAVVKFSLLFGRFCGFYIAFEILQFCSVDFVSVGSVLQFLIL